MLRAASHWLFVHRADAGPDDLGDEGGGVYHQSRHDALGIRQFKGHQLGQTDPEEIQLEKDGGAPEDLHIYIEGGRRIFRRLIRMRATTMPSRAPKEHGDCRDPEGAPTGLRGTPDNISTKP